MIDKYILPPATSAILAIFIYFHRFHALPTPSFDDFGATGSMNYLKDLAHPENCCRGTST
jgi:hypothetical protein